MADSSASLTTDQRGILRPQGSGCDIGAYEYEVIPFQAFSTDSLLKVGQTTQLSATGGKGSGLVTFKVVSGAACSISGSKLTAVKPGICAVVATKAADAANRTSSSQPVTITVDLIAQVGLRVFAGTTTLKAGGTTSLSAAGGTGTGAISYAVISGSCTVQGSSLHANSAGVCQVKAVKAADSTYAVGTSNPISIYVTS